MKPVNKEIKNHLNLNAMKGLVFLYKDIDVPFIALQPDMTTDIIFKLTNEFRLPEIVRNSRIQLIQYYK